MHVPYMWQERGWGWGDIHFPRYIFAKNMMKGDI
jgi:hypothetical protein